MVHALEAGTIFILLLAYIWYFQAHVHWSWMILLAIVLLSHAVRGESPIELGLRREGFIECTRRFAIPVLVVAAAGVIAGFAFDTVRSVAAWRVAGVLVGYCFWALFQQYLLNGYFANRLQASLDTRYRFLVAPLAGMMFAAAHVPNPLLMGVTLVGGTVAAWAYQRHRNLFFLAFAHAHRDDALARGSRHGESSSSRGAGDEADACAHCTWTVLGRRHVEWPFIVSVSLG
jgi:hypothetical protein